MTPPLCVQCEENPVTRAKVATARRRTRAARVVGGRTWNWTCSRPCYQKRHRAEKLAKLNAGKRQSDAQRLIGRLRSEAEAMGAAGRVTLSALVSFGLRCHRRGYVRGYGAAFYQIRRKALS